ncbi:MAG: hypothetical protein H7Z41_12735 [Cytophagales bacterium]|nr:hypothetical protein [Armatimonadota bacterium]
MSDQTVNKLSPVTLPKPSDNDASGLNQEIAEATDTTSITLSADTHAGEIGGTGLRDITTTEEADARAAQLGGDPDVADAER